jgi:pyruvate,orthophosphate dikinase
LRIEARRYSIQTALTQTTMGLSRDDYTKFSKEYENLKIFKADPFASIDQEGVGQLIEMAIKLGARLAQISKSASAASMAASQLG